MFNAFSKYMFYCKKMNRSSRRNHAEVSKLSHRWNPCDKVPWKTTCEAVKHHTVNSLLAYTRLPLTSSKCLRFVKRMSISVLLGFNCACVCESVWVRILLFAQRYVFFFHLVACANCLYRSATSATAAFSEKRYFAPLRVGQAVCLVFTAGYPHFPATIIEKCSSR